MGRYRLNRKLGLTTPSDVRVLTKQDIIEIIKYLIQLINNKAAIDDIDHLSNRRIRTVGEQLANQFSVAASGLSASSSPTSSASASPVWHVPSARG